MTCAPHNCNIAFYAFVLFQFAFAFNFFFWVLFFNLFSLCVFFCVYVFYFLCPLSLSCFYYRVPLDACKFACFFIFGLGIIVSSWFSHKLLIISICSFLIVGWVAKHCRKIRFVRGIFFDWCGAQIIFARRTNRICGPHISGLCAAQIGAHKSDLCGAHFRSLRRTRRISAPHNSDLCAAQIGFVRRTNRSCDAHKSDLSGAQLRFVRRTNPICAEPRAASRRLGFGGTHPARFVRRTNAICAAHKSDLCAAQMHRFDLCAAQIQFLPGEKNTHAKNVQAKKPPFFFHCASHKSGFC